jgi:Mg2+/Co2+ transporter CorB
VVDALKRRVHELHATAISMYQTDVKRKILEAANTDLQYRELVAMLQQGKILRKMDIYKLGVDGILLHKNRIFVPNVQDLKCIISHEMHNLPYARHPRYQKTVTAVKSQYFWPGMKREIA